MRAFGSQATARGILAPRRQDAKVLSEGNLEEGCNLLPLRLCALAREGMSRLSCARLRSSWRTESMARDPIVEEVRRARDKYAARFNYDLTAIFRDLQDRQDRGEFPVVRRKPRPPRVQPPGSRRRAVVSWSPSHPFFLLSGWGKVRFFGVGRERREPGELSQRLRARLPHWRSARAAKVWYRTLEPAH